MSETIKKIRTLLGIQEDTLEIKEEPKVELEEQPIEEEKPEEEKMEQDIEEKLSMLGLDSEMIEKVLSVMEDYKPKEEEVMPEVEMSKQETKENEVEILAKEIQPVLKAMLSRIEALEDQPATKGVVYSPSVTTTTSDVNLKSMKTKDRAHALINQFKKN